MVAAKSEVMAPVNATIISAVSERLNIGLHLATRKTPAVTIVAACISALTGVGPSIASGSHTWSGICADFPIEPQKRRSAINVIRCTSYPRKLIVWDAKPFACEKTGS